MPWIFWASDQHQKSPNSTSTSNADPAPKKSSYTLPQTLTLCALSTGATLLGLRTYKIYLRRIRNISALRPSHLRSGRSLYGYVTSVGDGDNFRFFHTPGGRLLGWGWIPWRREYLTKQRLGSDETLHVRIAGVDAPECAHFGRPAQPFSREALEWLRGYVQGRYVRVWAWRRDQYDRVVCTVTLRRMGGLVRRDVGEEMLKNGWATVYEAKFGSEFGSKEQEYREAEERAKKREVGMWSQPGLVGKILGRKRVEDRESPRQYKDRMKKEDLAK